MAALAAPTAWSTVEKGGALVGTGTKLSLGVAAIAVATWIAWPRLEIESPPPPAAQFLAEAPALDSPAPPGIAGSGPGAREELQAAPEKVAPTTTGERSGEPTEAECAAMEELVPASTVAGIVLRGRIPIDHGWAYLRAGNLQVPADPTEPWSGILSASARPMEPRRCPIGSDGRFAFEGVPVDYYTLAIDAGEGTVRQMALNLMRGGRPARSIVIVLGSARIGGHVREADGRALEGARVVGYLETVRNREVRSFASVAWTDVQGAYELRDLPAGSYLVGMRRDGSAKDPNLDETVEVDVPIGERIVVDFGRARPLPWWEGTVRARTGEPAAGGGVLLLVGETDHRKLEIRYDLEGGFRVALPPGRYAARARAVGDPMRLVDLGTHAVAEDGLREDLVLPGTRVRGLANDAATGRIFSRNMEQEVSVHPLGADHPSAITSRRIEPDGSFVFDGLEPGTWVVRAYPLDLRGEAEGAVELTILPGELEVPLSVTIVPRGP
jgi:hypothetical protein